MTDQFLSSPLSEVHIVQSLNDDINEIHETYIDPCGNLTMDPLHVPANQIDINIEEDDVEELYEISDIAEVH